ncbi:adenosine-specific kinase [bacterium]|nr:adenosine-specific kinase [bacterium]
MKIETVKINFPEGANIIFGQSHFIKTVEDLYEAMVNSVPSARFGIAFSEASGDRLVRFDGNDEGLTKIATKNLMAISSGHCFLIIMQDCFPINVLGAVKAVPEVCNIFCATANQVEAIIARNEAGNGAILGVIDGEAPLGAEDEEAKTCRYGFLRKIGYKK